MFLEFTFDRYTNVPSFSLGCGNMRRHFWLSSHRQNLAAPFFSSPIWRDVSSRRFFLNSAAVYKYVFFIHAQSRICWINSFTSSFGKCRDGILFRRTWVNSSNVEILTSVETSIFSAYLCEKLQCRVAFLVSSKNSSTISIPHDTD